MACVDQSWLTSSSNLVTQLDRNNKKKCSRISKSDSSRVPWRFLTKFGENLENFVLVNCIETYFARSESEIGSDDIPPQHVVCTHNPLREKKELSGMRSRPVHHEAHKPHELNQQLLFQDSLGGYFYFWKSITYQFKKYNTERRYSPFLLINRLQFVLRDLLWWPE